MEKGNQDRLLPMTPDFAKFLHAIPKHQRTGPVFRPLAMSGRECRREDYAGKVISSIGRLAGVKVDTDMRTKKVKYASAHDLRRAFGARWATRVMPIVLQQLMRHESIETTLKYYVGQNAEAMADAVWATVEKVGTSVGTSASGALLPETQKAETLDG